MLFALCLSMFFSHAQAQQNRIGVRLVNNIGEFFDRVTEYRMRKRNAIRRMAMRGLEKHSI